MLATCTDWDFCDIAVFGLVGAGAGSQANGLANQVGLGKRTCLM